jgi:hypothetical protein
LPDVAAYPAASEAEVLYPHWPDAAVEVGEAVYGVAQTSCAGHEGQLAVLYRGRLLSSDGSTSQLEVERREALARHPGSEGISMAGWDCQPVRRLCHGPLDFAAYGGSRRSGDRVSLPRDRVFPARQGPLLAGARVLERTCSAP